MDMITKIIWSSVIVAAAMIIGGILDHCRTKYYRKKVLRYIVKHEWYKDGFYFNYGKYQFCTLSGVVFISSNGWLNEVEYKHIWKHLAVREKLKREEKFLLENKLENFEKYL